MTEIRKVERDGAETTPQVRVTLVLAPGEEVAELRNAAEVLHWRGRELLKDWER